MEKSIVVFQFIIINSLPLLVTMISNKLNVYNQLTPDKQKVRDTILKLIGGLLFIRNWNLGQYVIDSCSTIVPLIMYIIILKQCDTYYKGKEFVVAAKSCYASMMLCNIVLFIELLITRDVAHSPAKFGFLISIPLQFSIACCRGYIKTHTFKRF